MMIRFLPRVCIILQLWTNTIYLLSIPFHWNTGGPCTVIFYFANWLCSCNPVSLSGCPIVLWLYIGLFYLEQPYVDLVYLLAIWQHVISIYLTVFNQKRLYSNYNSDLIESKESLSLPSNKNLIPTSMILNIRWNKKYRFKRRNFPLDSILSSSIPLFDHQT